MNNDFEFYYENIKNISINITRDSIFNYYNLYKSTDVFDDYLNIKCKNCKKMFLLY